MRTATTPSATGLDLEHIAGAIGLDPDELLRQVARGPRLQDELAAILESDDGAAISMVIRRGILVDENA